MSVAASVRFARRFRHEKRFSWNSLLVALSYLALWTPVAIVHLLSYGPFRIQVPNVVFQVTNTQITDLIGTVSPLATIVLRLSYTPIWEALCFRPLRRPARGSFQPLGTDTETN